MNRRGDLELSLRRREDLDLDAVHRVAWNGASVHLHDEARQAMARSRKAFLALLDTQPDLVVYGVTSGYGQRASERLGADQRKAHARMPPIAPMTGLGTPLPTRVVRAIVLARLANFVEGHAAVTTELADAVIGLLNDGPLPAVPAGGMGCAGEIQPLSHLFSEMASVFPLSEKEALALVNGSPVSAALLADAVLAGQRRQDLAESVFALSIEALQAPLDAYDPAFGALWQDEDEAAALAALGRLLDGAGGARRPYQAPVSWRILPRVLGQARRALRQGREVAAASLCAVTDNPVFLPPSEANPLGRVISNGGYHNARAYPALDALTAVYADLALLADRHVTKLLDGKVSLLPHQLQDGRGYLGTVGFTAAGLAEQARRAAQTTLLQGSEGGGFGQNDVAVPIMHAWQRHQEAAWCLEAALATLSVVCSQAFHVTQRTPPEALRGRLAEVRATVPPVTEPRALGPQIEALAAAWRERTTPDCG